MKHQLIARGLALLMLVTAGAAAFGLGDPDYEIDWFDLGGSDASSGGDLTLVGTPDHTGNGVMTGGEFILVGGAQLLPPTATPCPADLTGDGDVGFADLTQLLGAWGACAASCPEDLSGDGEVGFADLTTVLGAWGPCP